MKANPEFPGAQFIHRPMVYAHDSWRTQSISCLIYSQKGVVVIVACKKFLKCG